MAHGIEVLDPVRPGSTRVVVEEIHRHVVHESWDARRVRGPAEDPGFPEADLVPIESCTHLHRTDDFRDRRRVEDRVLRHRLELRLDRAMQFLFGDKLA